MAQNVINRTKIYRRDKKRCVYCTVRLERNQMTVDHVIPKSKGGCNKPWNLVLSCWPCNWKKGDSDPSPEMLDLVLRRKIMYDSRISIGKAIALCKLQNNYEEVRKLIAMQARITEAIHSGSTDLTLLSLVAA